ncbi:hypothetical protein AB0C02_19520 [Micromonospora sp. NPDC048999]|uniref:hypothetical protein n=1 Tax=Micromonospora sp. NPDC048999 TaxID=3155391 RepID=UPI0034114152
MLIRRLHRRPAAGRRSAQEGVGALWDAYQDSRFGYVTGRLPDVLHRAQAAADQYDGEDQDQARRLLGLAYQLAATQLTKLGQADLAWIAAAAASPPSDKPATPSSPAPCSARSATPCTPPPAPTPKPYASPRTPPATLSPT